MKPPRPTLALRSVMRRYRGLELFGVLLVFFLFLACVAGAILNPASAIGLGFIDFMLIVFGLPLWDYWRAETSPASFSLAERVKYRVSRLAEELRKYDQLFDDPFRRRTTGWKVRAISAGLFGSIRPYTDEAIQQTGSADLFVADAADFAPEILKATRIISGVVHAEIRLPNQLGEKLDHLVALLDEDSLHYDQGKRAAVAEIVSLLDKSGIAPDPNVGKPRAELFATRLKAGTAAFSGVLQAVGLWILFTIVYALLYFFVPQVSEVMSRDVAVTTYVAVSVGIFLGYPLYRRR